MHAVEAVVASVDIALRTVPQDMLGLMLTMVVFNSPQNEVLSLRAVQQQHAELSELHSRLAKEAQLHLQVSEGCNCNAMCCVSGMQGLPCDLRSCEGCCASQHIVCDAVVAGWACMFTNNHASAIMHQQSLHHIPPVSTPRSASCYYMNTTLNNTPAPPTT